MAKVSLLVYLMMVCMAKVLLGNLFAMLCVGLVSIQPIIDAMQFELTVLHFDCLCQLMKNGVLGAILSYGFLTHALLYCKKLTHDLYLYFH